ncbi:MAG: hypothetical protein MKZ70_10675 [Opitutales bacterium]|nr:hypothetical protein [Opitutales bacterium]
MVATAPLILPSKLFGAVCFPVDRPMGLASTRNEIPPVLPEVLPDKVPGDIHGENVVILELGKRGTGK